MRVGIGIDVGMSQGARVSGGDSSISNVVLLAGFNGVDGATTFTDESPAPRTMTAVGAAQIDTAQSKFGTSSLLLNGTTDAVTCPDGAEWEFGAGQFTVEGFFRYSTVADGELINHCDGSNIGWRLRRTSGNLTFFTSGAPGTLGIAWTPTAGVWYHVAADRDATGVIRTYIDGVFQQKTSASGAAIGDPAVPLAIGRNAALAANYFNGWIDEVRITKGVARYASDAGFTVPTAAFPRS